MSYSLISRTIFPTDFHPFPAPRYTNSRYPQPVATVSMQSRATNVIRH